MDKTKIEYRKLTDLVPYENNPRDNDSAVDAVAASIEEFGFLQPIVIDKGDIIVAGHTRHKAAEKLGLKEVPTIKAEDLTEEQIKAYRLADNKTAELADWNFDMLTDELTEIKDLDMTSFGFDDGSVEEEKYSSQEETIANEERPEGRLIIAAVSLFSEDNEAFIVHELKHGTEAKILAAMEDKGSAEIGGVIERAIEEAI